MAKRPLFTLSLIIAVLFLAQPIFAQSRTGKLSRQDYMAIAESIRDLCRKMAGNAIADKIYTGLVEILEAESN